MEVIIIGGLVSIVILVLYFVGWWVSEHSNSRFWCRWGWHKVATGNGYWGLDGLDRCPRCGCRYSERYKKK